MVKNICCPCSSQHARTSGRAYTACTSSSSTSGPHSQLHTYMSIYIHEDTCTQIKIAKSLKIELHGCYTCMYVCTICILGAQRGQKSVLDPWNWNYSWLLAVMWLLDSNLHSLKEQLMLLTAEQTFKIIKSFLNRDLGARHGGTSLSY